MLFFKEERLNDEKKIKDYNIKDGETLLLILRGRGGAVIDNIIDEINEHNKYIGFDIKLIKRNELNVNLIFFDYNLTNEENFLYLNKFKIDVVGGFHAVDDLNILKNYLEKIKNKCISFIIVCSGSSAKDVIPICKKYSFIKEVIIFCFNYQKYIHFIKDYPNYVKKVFTNINSVYEYIQTFDKKNKNKYIEKYNFFFNFDEIKMDKQIEQCPVISASEYDNCYFLVHRTYAYFFGDINNPKISACYHMWEIFWIEDLFRRIKNIQKKEKDDLLNKFYLLSHYTTNDKFVEKCIKYYTEESSFCYLFNRMMRNFEPGLISFSYFMGPFLFALNKYVKENPSFGFSKNMTFFRKFLCSQIEFYQYRINLGHIICFPSLTSTSSQYIEFKPTALSAQVNNNNTDEKLLVKLIIEYKHEEGNISPGIIIEDKKNKSGEYLSSNPFEKEVILFPFTFIRINSIEKEIVQNKEIKVIKSEIINRKSYIEYTLRDDVQNRMLFSKLD